MRTLTGVAVLLVACGGPRTVGESCDLLAESLCDRGIECGLIHRSQRGDCLALGPRSCCGTQGTCQDEVRSTAAVLTCNSDIQQAECGQIAKGVPPATCLMVAVPR